MDPVGVHFDTGKNFGLIDTLNATAFPGKAFPVTAFGNPSSIHDPDFVAIEGFPSTVTHLDSSSIDIDKLQEVTTDGECFNCMKHEKHFETY